MRENSKCCIEFWLWDFFSWNACSSKFSIFWEGAVHCDWASLHCHFVTTLRTTVSLISAPKSHFRLRHRRRNWTQLHCGKKQGSLLASIPFHQISKEKLPILRKNERWRRFCCCKLLNEASSVKVLSPLLLELWHMFHYFPWRRRSQWKQTFEEKPSWKKIFAAFPRMVIHFSKFPNTEIEITAGGLAISRRRRRFCEKKTPIN